MLKTSCKLLYLLTDYPFMSQRWLAKYYSPRAAEEKQNGFCRYVTNKVTP